MRRVALLTALLLGGCYESFERPPGIGADASPPPPPIGVDAGPPPVGMDAGPPPIGVDAGPPPIGVDAGPPAGRALDLLVVVDDSSSMTEEQESLAVELPRLLAILTTGDSDQDGRLDGPDDFAPVDVQLGVVVSDLGTGGYVVPTCEDPDFGEDGLLRRNGNARGCRRPGPTFLAFGAGPLDALLEEAACRARQGGGGCGFEQPLEAALKALSPAARNPSVAPGYEPPRFFRDTVGHGDGANAGFLRNGSVLAVVPFTDEDDCSAADPSLYDLSGASPYAMTPPNVRCFVHGDEALHPTGRFVRGLAQLRPSARRLVFAPVAGVPVDLVPPPGEAPDWDRLISDDADERDPRMVERVDPTSPDGLVPSCNVPGRGTAYPPVRLLRTARELQRLGAQVRVESICQEGYTGLVGAFRRALGE